MTVEQIAQQALALPLAERIELAQSLWQSIEAAAPTMNESPELSELIRSRIAEVDAGAVPVFTHEQVLRDIRQALGCG